MRESKYISETPLSYRKDYGQFFTPPLIAHLMALWVMKDNPENILDPAFGLGVFYDEIKKINLNHKIRFTGYEIDKRILAYLNHDGNNSNLSIINDDYLEADIGVFDGIICNPPYMRFQKFLKRHNVLPKIEGKIGKKLVGYSNIASVFLVKALKELNFNGRLAFIMPFEFFNTGYGKEIKKCLLAENLLKQIVIFTNEKEVFADATTTVCILLCKKDGKDDSIKITLVENENDISKLSDISDFYQHEVIRYDLPHNKKWTPIISSLFSKQKIPDGFCKLSLYGAFKRGIATGANEFFALTKSKMEELKMDEDNVCKCITKSPQIKKAVFTEDDFNALYNDDKPVHCLDVKDHNAPSVVNYIKNGEQLGLHKRYLTKKREPWYKIEHRQPAPILFGVFNRGRLKVIRNYSTTINFTCFHSFYPNVFGGGSVNKLFIYLFSDRGQSIIKMNKRSYGNNLDKLEPGDLNDCLCPNQEQLLLIEDSEAERVIEVAKINEKLAIHISNDLVDRIINTQQSVRSHTGKSTAPQ
jgi:adenine-specific DNA-methyltransferase